jgi:hypothetical protein
MKYEFFRSRSECLAPTILSPHSCSPAHSRRYPAHSPQSPGPSSPGRSPVHPANTPAGHESVGAKHFKIRLSNSGVNEMLCLFLIGFTQDEMISILRFGQSIRSRCVNVRCRSECLAPTIPSPRSYSPAHSPRYPAHHGSNASLRGQQRDLADDAARHRDRASLPVVFLDNPDSETQQPREDTQAYPCPHVKHTNGTVNGAIYPRLVT